MKFDTAAFNQFFPVDQMPMVLEFVTDMKHHQERIDYAVQAVTNAATKLDFNIPLIHWPLINQRNRATSVSINQVFNAVNNVDLWYRPRENIVNKELRRRCFRLLNRMINERMSYRTITKKMSDLSFALRDSVNEYNEADLMRKDIYGDTPDLSFFYTAHRVKRKLTFDEAFTECNKRSRIIQGLDEPLIIDID